MLLLLSPETGAGINAIAVNLTIGLTRDGHRVLLGSACRQPLLRTWLECPGNNRNALLDSYPGLKWQQQLEVSELENITSEPLDYLIYIAGEEEKTLEVLKKYQPLVLCIVDAGKDNKDDVEGIISLNEKLRLSSRGTAGYRSVNPKQDPPWRVGKKQQLSFRPGTTLGLGKGG